MQVHLLQCLLVTVSACNLDLTTRLEHLLIALRSLVKPGLHTHKSQVASLFFEHLLQYSTLSTGCTQPCISNLLQHCIHNVNHLSDALGLFVVLDQRVPAFVVLSNLCQYRSSN